MLVGNDVVDLHDPLSQPDEIHPRFDTRAFTPAERATLRTSFSTHERRWCLWAAKESAFKVARKLDAGVRFLPRDFAVRMLDDSRAEVIHRVGRFRVWFERADQWLHAVALPEADASVFTRPDTPARPEVSAGSVREVHRPEDVPAGVASRIGLVDEERTGTPHGGDRPSVRVREVVRSAIGSLLDVASHEIRVVIEEGVPTLHRRVERLPFDLSLSHHGRFVACAWAAHGLPSG